MRLNGVYKGDWLGMSADEHISQAETLASWAVKELYEDGPSREIEFGLMISAIHVEVAKIMDGAIR